MLANLLVSLTAIMGGVLGYFASHLLTSFAHYLVPIAAGGFLYISAADLIPELRHVSSTKKTFAMIATFLFGVGIMMLVKE